MHDLVFWQAKRARSRFVAPYWAPPNHPHAFSPAPWQKSGTFRNMMVRSGNSFEKRTSTSSAWRRVSQKPEPVPKLPDAGTLKPSRANLVQTCTWPLLSKETVARRCHKSDKPTLNNRRNYPCCRCRDFISILEQAKLVMVASPKIQRRREHLTGSWEPHQMRFSERQSNLNPFLSIPYPKEGCLHRKYRQTGNRYVSSTRKNFKERCP
jgi:hypothetical protein